MDATLTSNTQFTGNVSERPIHVIGSSTSISTLLLSGNTIPQVILEQTDPTITVTGNTFTSAEPIAFYTAGTATFSGNSYVSPKRIGVYGNFTENTTWSNIENLNLPYFLYNDVTVASGATLTIEGGTVVKFDVYTGSYAHEYNRCLIVNGTLDLQSGPGNQIVFTSEYDDLYGGDSNGDGTATAPGSTNWGYIMLNNSSTDFHDVLVRYGGYKRDFNGAWRNHQVWVNSATPVIRDSTFEYGYEEAVHYSGTFTIGPSIINSNFLNTSNQGVNNTSGTVVDARYNWWGNTSGPSGEGPGSGSAVSTNVLYDPWLSSPAGDEGIRPVIISSPNTAAVALHPYHYDIDSQASANGTGTIVWSKILGPADFYIDPNTGEIEWMPVEPGDYVVGITASDEVGTTPQVWQIHVTAIGDVTPPQIVSFAHVITSQGGGLMKAELISIFSEGVQVRPIDIAVLDPLNQAVPLTNVSYAIATHELTIVVQHLIENTTYTLRLLDTITDDALNPLDGEFDGYTFPTGNGAAGGDFAVPFSTTSEEVPADFDSDGDVDGEDLGVWETGYGMTTGANLLDGDADGDGDVDGNDFLAWQLNFGSSTMASGFAASSSGDTLIPPQTPDSGNGAFLSKTGESNGLPNNTKAAALSPALVRSNSQVPYALSVDHQNTTFESVDFAGWSVPQPLPRTNGNTTAWLDIPQFQSRDASRPFHRDRAVDAVMSGLDERMRQIDLERVHDKVADIPFTDFMSVYDEISKTSRTGKIALQQVTGRSMVIDDRVDMETALEELVAVPLLKPSAVLRV